MNGIINVIKPPGMSSNQATVRLKKLFEVKRIGHAGTLDPGAAGVLVVLVGKSTRLSDYLMGQTKTYVAELALGCCTDTLDSYGAVTGKQPPKSVYTAQQVQSVCDTFVGEIAQIPPDYSAVHINGKRAYALARKGEKIEKPARKVQIDSIKVMQKTGEHKFLLAVQCAKGTYIRTLLEDIASKLGELGYTSLLIRTKSGQRHIGDGYTLDEIEQLFALGDRSFLIPPEAVLAALPAVHLPESYAFALRNGQKVLPKEPLPDGEFRLFIGERFYGVAVRQPDKLRIKTPLYTE